MGETTPAMHSLFFLCFISLVLADWATYFGGTGDDLAWSVVSDSSGNIYVAGSTDSTDLPTTTGVFQTSNPGGRSLFVAALDKSGSSIIWSTYVGGTGSDEVYKIILFQDSKPVVVGHTTGYNGTGRYPTTTGAIFEECPLNDPVGLQGFVTMLSADGTALEWSTLICGEGDVELRDIVFVENVENTTDDFFYIVGDVNDHLRYDLLSGTLGWGGGCWCNIVPFQDCVTDNGDGTYTAQMGYQNMEYYTVNIDIGYYNYFYPGDQNRGQPTSFPPGTYHNLFNVTWNGGYMKWHLDDSNVYLSTMVSACPQEDTVFEDALILKITLDGQTLTDCAYHGGSDYETGHGIVFNSFNDKLYITGSTNSENMPVSTPESPSAYQEVKASEWDCYIAAFNVTDLSMVHSTFIGGDHNDFCFAVDSYLSGQVVITGVSQSTDYPVQTLLSTTYDHLNTCPSYAYPIVTRFLEDLSNITWSNYEESPVNTTTIGWDVAVDSKNRTYVFGEGIVKGDGLYDKFFGNGSWLIAYASDMASKVQYVGWGGDTTTENDYHGGTLTANHEGPIMTSPVLSALIPTSGVYQSSNAGGYDIGILKIDCPPGYAGDWYNCTICPVGSYSLGEVDTCTDCDPGTYQDETGQTLCDPCPVGTSENETGSALCDDCACGHVQPSTGQTECDPCAVGSYQDSTGQTSCTPCAVGTSQDATGQCSCDPCAAGTSQDETGQSTCDSCACGYVQPSTGQSSCDPCAIGTYQDSTGQTTCIPCAVGTSQSQTGQCTCDPCACGHSQDETGQGSCDACLAGTYQDSTGQTSCIPCAVGTAQPSTGQCSCPACLAGTVQSLTGQETCDACPCGSVQPLTGQIACDLCAAGSYQDATGQTECLSCAAGTSQDETGQCACDPCPAGSYQDATGQTECIPCPAGTYQDETGQISCKPCPGGSYENETGSTQCDLCPPGTFENETSSLQCDPCPVGTYQNESGQTECVPCAAGTVQDETGHESCDPCAAGSYQDQTGQTECVSCPCGTSQDQTGQTSCDPCAVGTSQSLTGQTSCDPCPTGTAQSETGQCSCDDCAAGTQQDEIGQSSCDPCTAGSYQPQTGQAECLPCACGTSQPLTGQTSCTPCSAGFAQPLTGQTSCDPCAVGSAQDETGQCSCDSCACGHVQDETGQTDCDPCAIGSYQDATGQQTCSPCDAGSYQNETGQCECVLCPAGTYQNETGQSVCLECEEGYHSLPGSTECTQACTPPDCNNHGTCNEELGECDCDDYYYDGPEGECSKYCEDNVTCVYGKWSLQTQHP